MKGIALRLCGVVGLVGGISVAHANLYDMTIDASQGSLSAEAKFHLDLSGLVTVTLTNNATTPSSGYAACLSGLLFTFNNGASLNNSNQSVFLTDSSDWLLHSDGTKSHTSTNIDPGYGFTFVTGQSTSGLPSSFYVFSASGIFDNSANFKNSGNPKGGLDGPGYTIESDAGDFFPTTSNQDPLVQDSVTFTLNSNLTDLSNMDNVWFQYGTASTEARFGGHTSRVVAPEPVTSSLVLGSIAIFLKRRRTAKAA